MDPIEYVAQAPSIKAARLPWERPETTTLQMREIEDVADLGVGFATSSCDTCSDL